MQRYRNTEIQRPEIQSYRNTKKIIQRYRDLEMCKDTEISKCEDTATQGYKDKEMH